MENIKSGYGELPVDLGKVETEASEYMFTQYVPISRPGSTIIHLPYNLEWVKPILEKVYKNNPQRYSEQYIYVTCKHMYVDGYSGNRPGWHSDGFLTEDVNYIWYDRSPTEFIDGKGILSFVQDHVKSLDEMEEAGNNHEIVVFPNKHVLRLDEKVIHQVGYAEPGFRTFLKVSLSKHMYNLKGNTKNPELLLECDYHDRNDLRNDPAGAQTDFML